jgi:hypothetical protein
VIGDSPTYLQANCPVVLWLVVGSSSNMWTDGHAPHLTHSNARRRPIPDSIDARSHVTSPADDHAGNSSLRMSTGTTRRYNGCFGASTTP